MLSDGIEQRWAALFIFCPHVVRTFSIYFPDLLMALSYSGENLLMAFDFSPVRTFSPGERSSSGEFYLLAFSVRAIARMVCVSF